MSYALRNRNGTVAADDKENSAANHVANLANLKDHIQGNKENVAKPTKKTIKGKAPSAAEEVVASPKKEPRRPVLGNKENDPNLHQVKEGVNSKVGKPKVAPGHSKVVKPKLPPVVEAEPEVVVKEAPPRKTRSKAEAKAEAAAAAIKEQHHPVAPKPQNPIEIDQTETAKPKEEARAVKASNKAAPKPSSAPKVVVAPKPQTPIAPPQPVLPAAPENDWEDLDADDINDPVMVAEYVVEIFEYMRRLELRTLAEPNYMEHQQELTWQMRSILIDWIVDVHNKFRLLPETLYLTVNIIDRFLSARVVSLSKLQLVGITALFIASKYEEIVAPSIDNLLYMAEHGYTQEEVVRAERYVLGALEFSIQYQSPMSFLRRGSKADGYDIQTRTLAKYLMEISIIDQRFLVCPPSEIAAAGLFLARRMLGRDEWDANLVHYSGYTVEQLDPCVTLMLDFLGTPTAHDAVYRKYSGKKFMRASVFVRQWIETNPVAAPVGNNDEAPATEEAGPSSE
ncbi:hypothetical protein SmJEL517_g01106 [Synchytrium microbalum]|uniref:Uncharacterized protein n=1 Tax=Synchytrium microbalum TaxID=1806994 RepID=A0A507CHZ3_9FUNG|nr:uncharacterized protein SmJEL517_g01106 [Synchytrium microbalum]TPX37243.1 hypothetical protein SmJEL517_g01106 [Synchytrium microbalum]